MSYSDAFTAISTTFSEAIAIAHPSQINQMGSYLLFNGAKSGSNSTETVSCLLIMVANSYTGENGIMDRMDGIRDRITRSPFALNLVSVRRAELNASTLYSVAVEITLGIT